MEMAKGRLCIMHVVFPSGISRANSFTSNRLSRICGRFGYACYAGLCTAKCQEGDQRTQSVFALLIAA